MFQDQKLQNSVKWNRSAIGAIAATLCDPPAFSYARKRRTKVQLLGLDYENKVCKKIEDELDPRKWVGFRGQWITYVKDYHVKYAQIDWFGICPEENKICIVEVKLVRNEDAFKQLNYLYKPLIEIIFPYCEISLVEVINHIKSISTPEPVKYVRGIEEALVGQTSVVRIAK